MKYKKMKEIGDKTPFIKQINSKGFTLKSSSINIFI